MMKQVLSLLRITPREWKLVMVIGVATAFISTVPTVFAVFNAPAGYVYTGIHSFTPGDYNVYFSYLEQVRQGHVLMKDLFTSEAQSRIVAQPFWTVAGLLGKLLHLSPLWTFHLVRILLIPVFCLSVYILTAFFLREVKKRLTALVLILFGSGWGVLLSGFLQGQRYESNGYYHAPPDLWVPESNGWLTMYNSPHILASTIFMVLFLLGILFLFSSQFSRKQKYVLSVATGFLALFWFSFHPFHVISMAMVVASYFLFHLFTEKKKALAHLPFLIVIALLALPAIGYHLWMIDHDPLASWRALQNACITPAFWLVVIGYGLLGIGGTLGLLYVVARRKKPYAFLACWFFFQGVALYLPVNYQRRMIQGWYIPMILLAVVVGPSLAQAVKQWIRPSWWSVISNPGFLAPFVGVAFFLSTIYTIPADIHLFRHPPENVIYQQKTWVDAMNWIKLNTPESSVFLSGPVNGNFLPAWTGRAVFYGHGVETIHSQEKGGELRKFFTGEFSLDEAQRFFRENRIEYLFFSGEEKKMGEFHPEKYPFLQKIFEAGETEVYKY